MISQAIYVAAFVAAIGCGLVAGTFFAFSSFVMPALGRIPPEQGINAMQSINIVVLNVSFLSLFVGTGILCVGLLGGSVVWWQETSGKLLLLASLLYIVGCFGVTRAFNIPLNDALAAARPATPEAAALWAHYLDRWTMWNTVRTVAPTASMILFVAALLLKA